MGDTVADTNSDGEKKESSPVKSMSDPTDQPSSPTVGADDAVSESNKRSERKRRREKQRRSDLSNAFDELAAFIVQVEPGNSEDDPDKKSKKRKSSDAGEDSAGITRLDLIGRALRIMKRLHRENQERKRVISLLEGRRGGQNDNVIVMVPTLAPTGEDPPPMARATYPGTYHHPGTNPYYAAAVSALPQPPSVSNGNDPMEYSMPPPNHGQDPGHFSMPPPNHMGYSPPWVTGPNAGYGGRPPQPTGGMTHNLHPQGTALRLPVKPPSTYHDGLPPPYLPPGNQK